MAPRFKVLPTKKIKSKRSAGLIADGDHRYLFLVSSLLTSVLTLDSDHISLLTKKAKTQFVITNSKSYNAPYFCRCYLKFNLVSKEFNLRLRRPFMRKTSRTIS